ncbi:MAG: hypothetical protein E7L02_07385 [Cutibacterium avidum]|nr:MAG: hypothetical protein Q613_PSC00272G0006 [Propionibacterium sp. DORA_15]MBS5745376.1 hypothetical protein [Propionibacterium sp.]MBS6120755.1 hypothetical protein [Streptococcus salivarius]MDU2314107.1 hypothetical protein [Cutibacterium avidum]MDU2351974.1 hypothetical protein [Cutibacterium avidum]
MTDGFRYSNEHLWLEARVLTDSGQTVRVKKFLTPQGVQKLYQEENEDFAIYSSVGEMVDLLMNDPRTQAISKKKLSLATDEDVERNLTITVAEESVREFFNAQKLQASSKLSAVIALLKVDNYETLKIFLKDNRITSATLRAWVNECRANLPEEPSDEWIEMYADYVVEQQKKLSSKSKKSKNEIVEGFWHKKQSE